MAIHSRGWAASGPEDSCDRLLLGGRLRPPWESEEAAFAFLLRVLAVCIAIALLAVVLKAIF